MSNTMAKFRKDQGLRAKAKEAVGKSDALEARLTQLEQSLGKVVGSINQVLGQVDMRVTGVSEILNATVEIIGEEKVNALLSQKEDEALQARREAEEEFLAEQIGSGRMYDAAEEEIDDTSYLVGTARDAEGEEQAPGRVAFYVDGLPPPLKEKAVGQKVGFVIDSEQGVTFEIVEHYKVKPEDEISEAEATTDEATTDEATTDEDEE